MFWDTLGAAAAHGKDVFLHSVVLGALAGGLAGGIASSWFAYAFARRLFRSRVLDHARREIKVPMAAYLEWLATLGGEIAVWKIDLLPSYLPDSGQDQFELNRMRKLFVDPRSGLWMARLEEYDAILPRFASVIRGMWVRQAAISEAFDRVFANLETDPPEAVKAGERLERLAFEQAQLVSDFLYQLQYECLRSVAQRKPKSPRDRLKPRIIRTSFGRVRLVSPEKT